MAFNQEVIATKFTAKINRDGPTPIHRPELGQCWIWTGGSRTKGYGRIKMSGRSIFVHRIAWELAYGPIPFGLSRGHHTHICHHCDNPACVRPDHLFAGTIELNTADKVAKNRQARGAKITGNRTTATGDRSGSRRHPERLRRGDNHPRRLHPEWWSNSSRDCNKEYPAQPPTDPRRARGEAHGIAVLDADRVRAIRIQRRAGAKFSQIAKDFCVSIGAIHKIISGKTWRHVV